MSAQDMKGFGELLNEDSKPRSNVICRLGTADDIIGQENSSESGPIDHYDWSHEYTEEEFKKDFDCDKTAREMFLEDPRTEVDFAWTEGEEVSVEDSKSISGVLFKPKKTAKITVKLPEEDMRTIDLKIEQGTVVVMYSHKFKSWFQAPKAFKESSLKVCFNKESHILAIDVALM